MISVTPLILAGGLGTRLRPAISDRPKVLSPVNGRPFLSYLLDQLVDAGMQEVILCTGHLGEMVREAFGHAYRGLAVLYSQESEPLGTGGSIRHALRLVHSEYVLAMNGDSYCNTDLRPYINWHFEKKYNASLLLTKVEDTSRYGRVKVDKNGRVLSFEEKGQNTESGWINAGIYLLKKELLKIIPAKVFYSLERKFLPMLVKKGLFGYLQQTEFIDIGTPVSYSSAEEFFSGASRQKTLGSSFLTDINKRNGGRKTPQ